MTEAYKKYEGSVEIPVLRALSFKHYIENRTLSINDGELIVGEKEILLMEHQHIQKFVVIQWKI